MIRRAFLAAASCSPLCAARANGRDMGVREALHRLLPPGIDPAALGAVLRATYPEWSAMEWRDRAAPGTVADLSARAAADFASGATIAVDGWLLSRTEALLCAALV